MSSKDRPLSGKAERFAHGYLAHDCNGTAAAIAAGYSKRSADSRASQLLADPRVQEIISESAQAVAGELEGEALDVFTELWNIAMAGPHDLVEWPDKAKLSAKLRALEKLMDFYQLIGPQEIEHRHEVTWSPAIREASECGR